ncbi:MAG TPA: phosphatase PAP2 family protein [Niastella sp.]
MAIYKQHKKLISREVLLLAALALISGLLFVWLARVVVIEKNDLFDTLAFNYFHQWTTPANTTIALVITRGGSDLFLIAIYLLVLYYLLRNKFKRQVLQLVIIVSASFLWNWLLKHFFQRPRPMLQHLDYVISYSFPSGHTQATFTLCGTLAYLTWKTELPLITKLIITVTLFLYACMIGLSRVYLHVHYLSDVAGGACFALCWLAVSAVVIRLAE